MKHLPSVISIFPLGRALLLPKGTLPLVIFEPRYLAMVNDALAGGRVFGMIQPKEKKPHNKKQPNPLYEIGCLGRITSFNEIEDGRILITLTGLNRFRVVRELKSDQHPFRQVEVDYLPFIHDLDNEPYEETINRKGLLSVLKRYLKKHHLQADWEAIHQATSSSLVTTLSIMSPYGVVEKQALLEAKDSIARCDLLIAFTEMALAQNEMTGDDDSYKPTLQ